MGTLLRRLFFGVAVLAGALLYGGADAAELTRQEIKAAKEAFKLAERQRWLEAKKAARGISDPLLAKIFRWRYYAAADSRAEFGEIAAFIEANPDWPRPRILRRRAEDAMTASTPDDVVIAWFSDHRPITSDGGTRLAASLLRRERTGKARQVIRETWIKGNFGAQQERRFYRAFRRHLTREDHLARLDRLLWAGRYYPTRRMYRRIHKDYRALAEARLALRRMRGGVDGAIRRVPAELRRHPGLVYERLRWRRRKGRDMDARALLADPPDDLIRPDMWWREKSILARRALRSGHFSEAYGMARSHSMTSGAGFLDGEWMAGWIATRFLGEHGIALEHFTAVYREANYAISRARGAYWAGRAAEELGDHKLAGFWFRTAAEYPMTYYGQLAAARHYGDGNLRMPPEPHRDVVENGGFLDHELVAAVHRLTEAGLPGEIDPFIRRLSELGQTPGWRAQVAALARDRGRRDLAVLAAKKAIREGVNLSGAGFPRLNARLRPGLEDPLVHAVIRQESAFNHEAISRAGARGLMQLMPATAKRVARQMAVPYRPSKLTRDIDYNLNIGQKYLADMIAKFEGSYILALAAYNAGPGRVQRWVRENGDPGDPAVDPIDWVEMIPLGETRNYVQRVMENLHVYRARLADEELAFNPEDDLRR